MKTEQPLWGRGIMISPQHFQQQVAYAAWSAEAIARMGLSQPWGVIHATFEQEMLKLGCLQARHLHIRFQDGTLIDTDNADALPPVLSIEVTLDSHGFAGRGDICLFGEMLSRFFALYTDIYLFNRLIIILQPTGERLEWEEKHNRRIPG